MSELTFETLRQVAGKLNLLLQREYDFLKSFWNAGQFCFASNDPGLNHVNVTSTCFCLFAILENDQLTASFSKDHKLPSGEGALTGIAKVLLEAPWKSEGLDENNILPRLSLLPLYTNSIRNLTTKRSSRALTAFLKILQREEQHLSLNIAQVRS